jgi:hypothetical protein
VHGESISGLTRARVAVWRPSIGGEEAAVLEYGEKRRRAGRGVVEDGGALPLYRGLGGRWQRSVVKIEKRPMLMGMKRLTFKWHLLHGRKRGGGGNGRGMRCGAQGSNSMAGQAGAALEGGRRPAVEVLPCFSEGGERGGRVGQKAKQAGGVVGPTGLEVKKIPFRLKIRFWNL